MSRIKCFVSNVISWKRKMRWNAKSFIDVIPCKRGNFQLIQRCCRVFIFVITRSRPHIRTRLHKSAILRRERLIGITPSARAPVLPDPERSEEFVNDRKATRSYLRTHMRSLSTPVNNLYATKAVCVNTPIYVSAYMCARAFESRREAFLFGYCFL